MFGLDFGAMEPHLLASTMRAIPVIQKQIVPRIVEEIRERESIDVSSILERITLEENQDLLATIAVDALERFLNESHLPGDPAPLATPGE